jgi:lipopolysaccharide biosynthesis regulator YciM/uncharacterized integral membrane protein
MAFRIFLPLFFIFFLFLYVAIFNPGDVKFYYAAGKFVNLPYVAVVMLSFLAGALSLSLIHFFKGVAELVNDLSNFIKQVGVSRIESKFTKARRLEADGKTESAIDLLEKILYKKPGHFGALLLKGSLLRKMGNVEEALRSHSLALAERPADMDAIRQIEEDYRAGGRLDAAYGMLGRLASVSKPSVELLAEMRDINIKLGEMTRAVSLQKRILTLTPDEAGARAAKIKMAEMYCLYGEQLSAEGNVDDAVANYDLALNAIPDFMPARILNADALAKAGRKDESESQLKKTFEVTGSLIPLLRLEERGAGGEALYRWAIAAKPEEKILWLFIILTKLKEKDYTGAKSAIVEAGESLSDIPAFNLSSALAEIASSGKVEPERLAKMENAWVESSKALVKFKCGACNVEEDEYLPQCPSCASWNAATVVIQGYPKK